MAKWFGENPFSEAVFHYECIKHGWTELQLPRNLYNLSPKNCRVTSQVIKRAVCCLRVSGQGTSHKRESKLQALLAPPNKKTPVLRAALACGKGRRLPYPSEIPRGGSQTSVLGAALFRAATLGLFHVHSIPEPALRSPWSSVRIGA